MINCYFENNNKASLRHITVGVIVTQGDKVLLGLRQAYKGRIMLEVGKWALLGGFMDRDENLEQCAKREVLEESGWEINNLRLFCINDRPDRPKEDRQNVDFIFYADAIREISKPDQEMKKVSWFNLHEIPQKTEIAFDHADYLALYKKYLKTKFPLPVLG